MHREFSHRNDGVFGLRMVYKKVCSSRSKRCPSSKFEASSGLRKQIHAQNGDSNHYPDVCMLLYLVTL